MGVIKEKAAQKDLACRAAAYLSLVDRRAVLGLKILKILRFATRSAVREDPEALSVVARNFHTPDTSVAQNPISAVIAPQASTWGESL